MKQEALDGLAAPGLYHRYVHNRHIDDAAWRAACASHSYVGTCPCGGQLKPRRPEKVAGRTDYAAACTSCGKEIQAPGGRIARPRRKTNDTGG